MDRGCQAAGGVHARGTHCVLTIQWVLRAAALAGVDAEEIAANWGLAGKALDDFSTRVTGDVLFGLWEEVMRRAGDPGLPVTAPQGSFTEQRSLVVLSAMTTKTLGDGMLDAARLSSAWTTVYSFEVHECPDGTSLRVNGLGTERLGERCEAEYTMSDVLNAARLALGPWLVPVRMSFMHPAPASIRSHQEWFGPGLCFDDEHTEIAFPPELTDLPLGTSQPNLHALIGRKLVDGGFDHAAMPTVTEQVRAAVLDGLAIGAVRASDVAVALHMSERTLHRRLAAEGAHLGGVVDDVRRRMALDLLEQSDLATKEIAAALGFGSARSFHRAFRRWTGSSPRQAIPRRR